MVSTKVNWYLGMILIVGILFSSFLVFTQTLVARYPTGLTDGSYSSVSQYLVYLENAGIIELSEEDITTLQNDGIIADQEGSQSVTDFLATISYYASKVQKVNNYLRLVYNIPSLFILSIGLPIGPFSGPLNFIGIVLFMSMVILLVRLVRGS